MNGIKFVCDGAGSLSPPILNFVGPFGDYIGKENQYCPQGFTGAMASIQGPQVSFQDMLGTIGSSCKVVRYFLKV
jgi:hypothetical protein